MITSLNRSKLMTEKSNIYNMVSCAVFVVMSLYLIRFSRLPLAFFVWTFISTTLENGCLFVLGLIFVNCLVEIPMTLESQVIMLMHKPMFHGMSFHTFRLTLHLISNYFLNHDILCEFTFGLYLVELCFLKELMTTIYLLFWFFLPIHLSRFVLWNDLGCISLQQSLWMWRSVITWMWLFWRFLWIILDCILIFVVFWAIYLWSPWNTLILEVKKTTLMEMFSC